MGNDGARIEAPGFQPYLAYEVAIANLNPELPRREPPASAEEVLAWAAGPPATAEVAEVLGVPLADARAQLGRKRRVICQALGSDALWSLSETPAVTAP